MLQIPETSARIAPARKPKMTPIQRAYSRLDAIQAEWVSLAGGGNEKRFGQLCDEGCKLASKIVEMSAQRAGDVLLKIAAAGVLMDRAADSIPLSEWQFKKSGYVSDDAGGCLLMSIRDDLRRLIPEQ